MREFLHYLPNDIVASAKYLSLRDLNWVKAPREVKTVLDETLSMHLERNWLNHSRDRDKLLTPASRLLIPTVFIPGQDNLACSEVDLGKVRIIPGLRQFDNAEFVVQGLTRENLDSRICPSVDIVGRLQGPNDFLKILQIAGRLKELGYKDVSLIAISLGFTRQDLSDEIKGEPNVIRILMRQLSVAVDRLVTWEAHSGETGRSALEFNLPYCNVSCWRDMTDILLKTNQSEGRFDLEGLINREYIVVGADDGSRGKSLMVATYLGVDLVSLAKKRDGHFGEISRLALTDEQIDQLRDKWIIIFDDTIATGETLETIADLTTGICKGIMVIATHASFQDDAIKRLSKKEFVKVIIADSRSFLNQPPRNGKFLEIASMGFVADFIKADRVPGFNPWQQWPGIVY